MDVSLSHLPQTTHQHKHGKPAYFKKPLINCHRMKDNLQKRVAARKKAGKPMGIKAYLGHAKFMTGCITRQVRSSRAMLRTRGPSCGFKAILNTPLMSC